MNTLLRHLRVIAHAERCLVTNELRLGAKKTQLVVFAGLVALFGLVMISIAAFYALVPHVGQSAAALIIAVVDFFIAGGLLAIAKGVGPAPELQLVKEMRDVAVGELHQEVETIDLEIKEIKTELSNFARNPLGSVLPIVTSSLVSSLVNAKKDTVK